jgi:hypothetical protein
VVIAIPDLIVFAVLLVAFGIVYNLKAFVDAIQQIVTRTVSQVPLIGGLLAGAFHAIAQPVSNILGTALQGIDGAMGTTWHLLARVVEWTGRELVGLANSTALIAKHIQDLITYALFNELRKLVLHAIHALTHAGSVVLKETVVINKRIAHGVEHRVLPGLKALEHAIAHTIPGELGALRHGERVLERDVTALQKWVRAHPFAWWTTAFAGAVAVALTRLGLEWIKCDAAKSVFSKRGCNLWNDLDALLGMLGTGLLLTNICSVIPLLESAFSTIAAPLVSTLASAGAGLCLPGSSPPAALPVPQLSVPSSPAVTTFVP